MTLIELQVTVERFAAMLCAEDVKRVVHHLRPRAEICVRKRGDTVKNRLKGDNELSFFLNKNYSTSILFLL